MPDDLGFLDDEVERRLWAKYQKLQYVVDDVNEALDVISPAPIPVREPSLVQEAVVPKRWGRVEAVARAALVCVVCLVVPIALGEPVQPWIFATWTIVTVGAVAIERRGQARREARILRGPRGYVEARYLDVPIIVDAADARRQLGEFPRPSEVPKQIGEKR